MRCNTKVCRDWCMARAFSPAAGCCGAELTSVRLVGRGMWRVIPHAHDTKRARYLGQSVEHEPHL